MTQTRILWIMGGLGVILLITLAITWFLLTHEQVEQRQDRRWPKAARANALLAAERLATQLGQPARSLRTLDDLPDKLPGQQDFLLLSTPSASLSETQREALLAWVAEGGHLLLAPQRFVGQEKDQAAAVSVSEQGAPSGSTSSPGAEQPVPQSSGDALLDTLRIQPQRRAVGCPVLFEGLCKKSPNVSFTTEGQRPLWAYFEPQQTLLDLEDNAHWRLTSSSGVHLVQRLWGEGRVTVVSDLDWLRNEAIGQHDHAALWWRLLAADARPAMVWLQYLPNTPAWWRLLLETASPLLLASALSLGLWLLRRAQRFGPLLPPPNSARRSLLEHIRASGYWLWHHRAAQALLDAQRHALRHRLSRRHPGWAEQSPAEQVAYLARLVAWPGARIEQALTASAQHSIRAFIQQMEDLRLLTHTV